ncbi:MAG: ankyrin repeat domain-containing protein [Gammaproteobacteria bacterium]|nr:MAG: ankyrin repeat domain-containing protein [Gammaproteobacteria bacterium]UTW41539.1 ankyrin repeat domain-containing protein [bacterium SCSIO 12844]
MGKRKIATESSNPQKRIKTDNAANLFWAVDDDDIDKVSQILKSDPELVNIRDLDHNTLLHKAAEKGSVRMVGILSYYGADIDALGDGGQGPIHLAAINGHLPVVKALYEKDHNIINQPNALSNNAPLHIAALKQNVKMVEFLIECGADIEAINIHREIPRDLTRNTKIHQIIDQAPSNGLNVKPDSNNELVQPQLINLEQSLYNEVSIRNSSNILNS